MRDGLWRRELEDGDDDDAWNQDFIIVFKGFMAPKGFTVGGRWNLLKILLEEIGFNIFLNIFSTFLITRSNFPSHGTVSKLK